LKTRVSLITGIGLVLCLAGLCIVAFQGATPLKGHLFFILPTEIGSPSFDVGRIEEFSEKEFLLTYEILSPEKISLSSQYPVTLVATNSTYPQILGLTMTEGSFFSKQAWTGKQRHGVLNEKAAFTIFGSSKIVGNRFRIRNDIWIVTGVINDGDEENSRVYIPSSIQGGEADALALTSSGGLDEAYVINSIKTLGLRDTHFSYINFQTFYRLFRDRAGIIPLLFISFLLLSLLRPLARKFREAWLATKNDLTRYYLREFLRKNPKSSLLLVFFTLSLFFFPILALFLFLHIASVCLPWQDIPSLASLYLGSLNPDLLYPHLVRIRNLELISRGFFGLSLVFLTYLLIGLNAWLLRKKCKKNFPK
jgi:hypothetical protein